MTRPLKKDGTEDMRYQDTFDGGDFAWVIGLAIVIFTGILIWSGVSALWDFYWGASEAIWDFQPFIILLATLLMSASIIIPIIVVFFVWIGMEALSGLDRFVALVVVAAIVLAVFWGVSPLWDFYWGASEAIWDFQPFIILLATLLMSATIIIPIIGAGFVWAVTESHALALLGLSAAIVLAVFWAM
jgi:hypothetical protein